MPKAYATTPKTEALDFQKKGAESQKSAVRKKVQDAIEALRTEQAKLTNEERTEVTIQHVLEESTVSKRTLEKPYHSLLLADVSRFLATINVGVAVTKRKPPPPERKSTIFEQNDALLQQVEALRYKLRTELAEKQRQIDAMAARVAALTDEIAMLRRGRRADRSTIAKESSRRSKVA